MRRIFCDFDGTITNRDSIVFLTEQFGAGPDYRMEILDGIKKGEMTVFEAIRRELETVTATWEEAVEALKANISVDPSFPAFVDWCKAQEIPLIVVSSGLSPVVDFFISEFEIPFYAHSVQIRADGWLYERVPAHDKENILRNSAGETETIFLGDGTSDVAAIPYVDRLFAKRGFYLEEYCRNERIPFSAFSDFAEICHTLDHPVND